MMSIDLNNVPSLKSHAVIVRNDLIGKEFAKRLNVV